MVSLVVVIRTKNTGGLHGASTLRTQNTSDLQTSSKCKTAAVIANPIILWDFVNTITFLVDRYIAHTTENN
jgi:hypothetical protein